MPGTRRKTKPSTMAGKSGTRAGGKNSPRKKSARVDTGSTVTDVTSFPGFLPSTIQKQ